MLPDKNRLKKKRDFEIVLEQGKFVGGALATLKYWNIDIEKFPKRKYSSEDLKIGFVVGLKVSKKAVVRNRLKRQMREAARLLLQKGHVAPGNMFFFMAKKEMIDQPFEPIAKDIEALLRRAHLLQK